MLVKTYVAASGIHGIGIFACEPIAPGTLIWQAMEGLDTVHDAALLDTAPEPIRSFLARYSYPHPSLPGKIMLDGDHGRFMNHNKTPNTDFRTMHENKGYAIAPIAQGEEITCDYDEFITSGKIFA